MRRQRSQVEQQVEALAAEQHPDAQRIKMVRFCGFFVLRLSLLSAPRQPSCEPAQCLRVPWCLLPDACESHKQTDTRNAQNCWPCSRQSCTRCR